MWYLWRGTLSNSGPGEGEKKNKYILHCHQNHFVDFIQFWQYYASEKQHSVCLFKFFISLLTWAVKAAAPHGMSKFF